VGNGVVRDELSDHTRDGLLHQHTQSRQQTATQRTLDELVRSLPHADNRLIAAESTSDEELEALGQLNATDRESAVSGQRSNNPDAAAESG